LLSNGTSARISRGGIAAAAAYELLHVAALLPPSPAASVAPQRQSSAVPDRAARACPTHPHRPVQVRARPAGLRTARTPPPAADGWRLPAHPAVPPRIPP